MNFVRSPVEKSAGDLFLIKQFFRNESGAFLPMFVIGAAVLFPMIGMAIDYSRLLGHKEKLQSAADSAVAAALLEKGGPGQQAKVAQNFLTANLPDSEIESRRSLREGRVVFQVRSKLETPVLSIIGQPHKWVHVESEMPIGVVGADGKFYDKRYTEKAIREMENKIKKMISEAPHKYQDNLREEYDKFFARVRTENKTMTGSSR